MKTKAVKIANHLKKFVKKYYNIPEEFIELEIDQYDCMTRVIVWLPVQIQSSRWRISLCVKPENIFWGMWCTVFGTPHEYQTVWSYQRTGYGKLIFSKEMKEAAELIVKRLQNGEEKIFRYPEANNRRPRVI